MTQSTIAKLNQALAEEFEIDESSITPEGSLIEILDLDSLDFVDLVVIIEANFGFKVNQEEIRKIKTFEQMYAYISEKAGSAIES